MIFPGNSVLRGAAFALLLLTTEPVRAEYLRIELKVYGLDCELCARGVGASVQKLPGVESVNVSLRTGLLEITLTRGNRFKMSDLRKRIRQNGFRSMEGKVTAVGRFNGPKFEVLGSGESYDLGSRASDAVAPMEMTFDVR
jgi:copper chaperone CopZ